MFDHIYIDYLIPQPLMLDRYDLKCFFTSKLSVCPNRILWLLWMIINLWKYTGIWVSHLAHIPNMKRKLIEYIITRKFSAFNLSCNSYYYQTWKSVCKIACTQFLYMYSCAWYAHSRSELSMCYIEWIWDSYRLW